MLWYLYIVHGMAKATSKQGDSYVWQLFEYLEFQEIESATHEGCFGFQEMVQSSKEAQRKKNLQHNWTGSTVQRLLVVKLDYRSELAITSIDGITTQQL